MSDEVDERREHLRAIAITSAASLAGVVAAIVSGVLTSDLIEAGDLGKAATHQDPQLAVLALVLVQLPVYHFVFEEWGGAKDVLYVAFMTFIMWFVTFGIIVTSEAQIP